MAGSKKRTIASRNNKPATGSGSKTAVSGKKEEKPSAAAGYRRRYLDTHAQPSCSVDKQAATKTKPTNSGSIPTVPTITHKTDSTKRATKSDDSKASQPLNAQQLACQKWFDRLAKKGLRELRLEFIKKVKKYTPDLPMTAFNDKANLDKNRYEDILLLDKTRVKVVTNPEGDDYIHASHVEVAPNLTYICAQGPLTNTIEQFWLMCHQEDAKVILQLCQNVEDGTEKCCDYLPTEKDEWTRVGSVQLKLINEGTKIPGTKKVTKTVVQCKFDGRISTITHILYFGWPDHGVAESVDTCREVRTIVHKLCEKKPIVVHCSAGIGRTGTFVAIEMVCHKLLNEHDGDFDMVELMKKLREQRAQAIQTDQQYAFIFRCVISILIVEDALAKTSQVTEFIESFDRMIARKREEMAKANKSKSKK